MSRRHCVIMAGGTGGHVFPGLAVARVLEQRGWTVSWLGTEAGLEARVVPEAGIELDVIAVQSLRGGGLSRWLQMPFRLARAVWQARRILTRRQPAMVLGMGGFASGPGGLAARSLALPLVIHEQNGVAGLTNRVLARMAARVLAGFPDSFPEKCRAEIVGNPVRRAVSALPPPEQRFEHRQGPVRILILGGSQGARALNEWVPQAVRQLPARQVQVRHQCGRRWREESLAAWQGSEIEVQVEAFISDMAEAWAWADLAICRAGALTVAELSAAGVASVLIPFPAAVDDHQTVNATYLERARAARLLPQPRLEAGELAELLKALTSDRSLLRNMAQRAREKACPDADQLVADACEAAAMEARGGAA
ncbi:UDP-N-acetylglucosamine--N-acetylmuramyl-(pentapeptide) pyrophosphoryl-undecaprenol N-acetylglucosamine transferase [Natronospira proteinivora]|uniref:UDP-N-acetylglucosamine--N-acetylmuramyl-(pentapeptide) pyrophosphoryl-undecaprenol N-acetylglucosamine transferase n=1 Tax=Natronospira proteinivora TaxID=1807133 RepID=A0ABT1G4A1_9GAMM|nr:undecaprenyldiphospho-muramoylpentapeptide beta-N-acetylglucosaminyltransferase [Natronospira proteinivora]MCP1726106.1 UDP-N-acetylglucosamine--N-acetylmuramyl-(pentapeptide) pyrophosphoryl-undecaprenol N-acetylglucosamine transferase [Natronospira proteinivora]